MNQRERNLAAVVGVLVLGWLGWGAWVRYESAVNTRVAARDSAQQDLERAAVEERVVKRALEQLEGYQQRSLPVDPQVARREYLGWLVDQLEASRLDFEDVNFTESRPGGDAFTSFGYSVKAKGSLDQITRFMHAFYDSPMLHKITLLKLTPRQRSQIQLNLNVQALTIAGAERESGIPEPGSGRPLLGDANAYVASVTGRDLFRQYVPPPPPRPPRPDPPPVVRRDPPPPRPKFDDAEHAYVTGIVQAGDRLQAWITVRTKGEVLRLSAGDEVHVGLLDGVVELVTPKQIVVRTNDQLFATPLGSHLREGEQVDEDALF